MKKVTNPNYLQHTLNQPIHFIGRGLHTGKHVSMSLHPAAADTGYVFRRTDLAPPYNVVPARWMTVTETRMSTTVGNNHGVSITTVEHLIAALFACGVDNCQIDIDGPEAPIMDGSAKPFVDQIVATGLQQQEKPRMALVMKEALWVNDGNAKAGIVPFPEPWMDMTIDFQSRAIGRQNIAMQLNQENFSECISAARTFGFAEHVETMKTLGLAQGGSMRNAVVVENDMVANPEGLRFDNEFVRHKVVDAVGDLALLGVNIVGCFVGHCSGHRLNNQLLRTLMYKEDKWALTTLEDAIVNWDSIMEDDKRQGWQSEF
ncbi:UDP-3-O-acyl-N-acetylglucosamine deacetylase [Pseudomaricurvus sp.]|uniref:UDP-3-O-acyl-N-acetylglucosamine deacetylase n=1 Tax=Pseudomaricurvus sp. TaxID=2004510 RepID=UPI003F6C208F